MENKKNVAELNDLLQITNDRLKGFQEVEKILIGTHPFLKGEYEHMVKQSEKMHTELASLIESKGGEAKDSTTVAGGLHRTWIDLKNSLTGNIDEATLENVAFGEKAAIDAYESALSSGNLCPESIILVQDQLKMLQDSYQSFQNREKEDL